MTEVMADSPTKIMYNKAKLALKSHRSSLDRGIESLLDENAEGRSIQQSIKLVKRKTMVTREMAIKNLSPDVSGLPTSVTNNTM